MPFTNENYDRHVHKTKGKYGGESMSVDDGFQWVPKGSDFGSWKNYNYDWEEKKCYSKRKPKSAKRRFAKKPQPKPYGKKDEKEMDEEELYLRTKEGLPPKVIFGCKLRSFDSIKTCDGKVCFNCLRELKIGKTKKERAILAKNTKKGGLFYFTPPGWFAQEIGVKRGFQDATVEGWVEARDALIEAEEKNEGKKNFVVPDLPGVAPSYGKLFPGEGDDFGGTTMADIDSQVWICRDCLKINSCRYCVGGGYNVRIVVVWF